MSTGNISPNSSSDGNDNCVQKMSASSFEDIPAQESSDLPKKLPIDLDKLFQRQPNIDVQKSTEEPSRKTVENLKSTIDATFKEKLFQWQDVSSWEFKFPETVFTGDEPPVQFHRQQQYYEETTGQNLSKLSDEQILSIREHGEFVVKSIRINNSNIGTTWRINPLLVKGNQQIKKTFLNTLSFAWGQLLEIPKRVTLKHKKDLSNHPNLFNGLRSVVSLVGEVANLTVGTVKMQQYTDEEVQQVLYKEYTEQTVLSYFEDMTSAFFKFVKEIDEQQQLKEQQLYKNILEWKSSQEVTEKYSKIQQNLDDFNAEFKTKAQELEQQKIQSLERGYLNEDEALYEILDAKQKLLFSMMEEKNQPENVAVRNHLKDIIKAAQITVRHYEQLAKEIANRRSDIEKQLMKDHPVKSLVYSWLNKQLKQQMKPIISELVLACNNMIITELSTQGLKSQEILFQRFSQFQMSSHKQFKNNYKRIQENNRTPSRVFETAQRILGEHKVIKSISSYDGQSYYQEESMKIYKTPTSFFGWRIVLNLLRWKAWTVNAFDITVNNAINGPLGIKALVKSKSFPRRYILDQRTGMKIPSGSDIKPYQQVLRDIYQGVINSRIAFEALPDRGIFGKRFARIFNYLECYVFRGLLTSGIVAFGMPIAILANCIISTILAITSGLWMPIPVILRWIYGILIYDLDSPSRNNWGSYSVFNNWLRYQTFEKYPLISAIGASVLGGIEITASIWSAAVIHPGLSFLGLISAFTQRAFSRISDYLMCGIIQRIGRQPDTDSKIAWKVKGGGVTQQYTESMQIEDVKVLVRSWLERTELDLHVSKLREEIQEPIQLYSQYVHQLFSQYSYSSNQSSYLTQNVDNLNQILSLQYQSRLNKLPVLPSCNVKFTEQELAELIPQCQSIVQSFIVAHKLQGQIFKINGLIDSDLTKLTENILIDIFHDADILFPTNELDKRIEIKTDKKHFYNAITRAIAGETDLNILKSTIAPRFRKFKRNEICRFVDNVEVENNARLRNQNQSRIITRQVFEDPSRECFYLPFGEFEKTQRILGKRTNENDKGKRTNENEEEEKKQEQ